MPLESPILSPRAKRKPYERGGRSVARYPRLPDVARRLVRAHQVEELQLTNIVQYHKEINGRSSESHDSGCNTPRQFKAPDGSTESIEGVIIKNRAALFSAIRENIEYRDGSYNGELMTVLMLDLARLEFANRAEDENRNKSADVILNKVAKALQEVCNSSEFVGKVKYLSNARYGGDEFAIAIIGGDDDHDTLVKAISDAVYKRVISDTGYYLQDDGTLASENIAIKHNTIEVYKVPEDPDQQAVYLHFIKRALFLDVDQIERVLAKKQRTDETTEAFLNRIYPTHFYPDNVESDKEKIDFIVSKNPQYGNELYKEYYRDIQRAQAGLPLRFPDELKHVEQVVFHPLFSEVMHSFHEVYDDLLKKKYSEVCSLDVKFVKECNDNRSYVDGDMVILSLWNKINTVLTPEEKNMMTIGVRGGTFFFCFTQQDELGTQLQKNIQTKLQTIQDVILFEGTPEEITVPVGFGTATFDYPDEKNKTEKYVKSQLNTMFRDIDTSWYTAILNDISNFFELPFAYQELIIQYFTGKRRDRRKGDALRVLEENEELKYIYDGRFASMVIDLLANPFQSLSEYTMTLFEHIDNKRAPLSAEDIKLKTHLRLEKEYTPVLEEFKHELQDVLKRSHYLNKGHEVGVGSKGIIEMFFQQLGQSISLVVLLNNVSTAPSPSDEQKIRYRELVNAAIATFFGTYEHPNIFLTAIYELIAEQATNELKLRKLEMILGDRILPALREDPALIAFAEKYQEIIL